MNRSGRKSLETVWFLQLKFVMKIGSMLIHFGRINRVQDQQTID